MAYCFVVILVNSILGFAQLENAREALIKIAESLNSTLQ